MLSYIPVWIIHIILFIGVVGWLLNFFISKIPVLLQYSTIIYFVSLFCLGFGLFLEGVSYNDTQWQEKKLDAKIAALNTQIASQKNSDKIVTEYVDVVRVVKEKGNVIIKEIPKVVTVLDSNCKLPNVFVRLHDSAATNTIPDAPSPTNAGASIISNAK